MGAGFAIRAKANQSAEILLYEDVGEGWFGGISAKTFAKELKALGRVKSIDVRINSYGGDVFDGLAIYQQLIGHGATITTHVDGVAASIASVIAMAGKEIRIAEAGWMMIHDAWGMAVGNAADMRRQADLLESVTAQLAGVYVARTGNKLEQLRAWMAEEKWFSATDAVDAGMATVISENMRMAAHGAPDRFKFRHVPAQLAGTPAAAANDDGTAWRAQVAAQATNMQRRRDLRQHKARGAA